jgi:hypothetical protein
MKSRAEWTLWAEKRKARTAAPVVPSPDVSFDVSLQREWQKQSGAPRGEVVNTSVVREYQPEAIVAGKLYPLVLLCQAHGLPAPMPEYVFSNSRGFKFDYAWIAQKVACEVEGGIWKRGGGGHSHPMHIMRDIEKYNLAVVEGWRVIRVVPERIGAAIPMLQEMLR